MTGQTQAFTPKFSPKFRTIIYVIGVLLSFAAFVVAGAAAALDAAPAVSIIAGLIGSGFGGVASSFGVGYRPTK